MDSPRFRQQLRQLFDAVQDATFLLATRWRQEPAAPGAPLAVRLAVHHDAVMGELRRSFLGLDLMADERIAMLILLGVVEAGKSQAAVEAASRVMLGSARDGA